MVNYVEPKIRLERAALILFEPKRHQGESGKEGKRFAKEVERLEDFVSELQDLEDKLRRAANLHLEPDLNDGVVLNIAPSTSSSPGERRRSIGTNSSPGSTSGRPSASSFGRKGL
ncbi:MAG: hypothetical protein IPM24_00555 [Bryobacterales bacterium]|nr:hypothetical protein [Bryobacterales bacterium]